MYSKTTCIDALCDAAEELGESPTKAQYEELGKRPSSQAIIRAFGRWNKAKNAAGLRTQPSSGPRVQSKPDNLEVMIDTPWEKLTVDQRWCYKNARADNQYEVTRRARLRAFITDYKDKSEGCLHCDVSDPRCLDFHHPIPAEKDLAVNKMVPYGYSRSDIIDEMEQCVLLCANCHRREHFEKFHPEGSGLPSMPLLEESLGLADWPDTASGLRDWSYAYRHALGCRCCGEIEPRCLQFHHVDPLTKRRSVGNMLSNGCTKDALRAEVSKCEILCVNCHRKAHREERDEAARGPQR